MFFNLKKKYFRGIIWLAFSLRLEGKIRSNQANTTYKTLTVCCQKSNSITATKRPNLIRLARSPFYKIIIMIKKNIFSEWINYLYCTALHWTARFGCFVLLHFDLSSSLCGALFGDRSIASLSSTSSNFTKFLWIFHDLYSILLISKQLVMCDMLF